MQYALMVTLAVSACTTAFAADDVLFDRVQAGAYADLQHEATLAYDRKDYVRAFELNRRIACAGDKTSQAILGRMYLLGLGTARDEINGYAWIRFAADFGFRDFTALAGKLEAALSPEQLRRGNARVAALRANYGPAVTNTSCHGEARHGALLIDAVICTPESGGAGNYLLRRCVD
jgi:hypothetical protein